MMQAIPLYEPYLEGNEKKYVQECMDSTWISSKGEFINKFGSKFSEYTGITHASTCSNGTVALHLALLALDIQAGDEIIVPTFTYVASVNAIKYCNAVPVFIDSIYKTLQLDHTKIVEKISARTKAIMVPHLYGYPAEIEEIVKIAKKYNLFVIEDCAEAFGTYHNNKHVGTLGDMATFSFFGNKTITTGEGGMVCSNNKLLIDKVNHYKAQGLASLNPNEISTQEYWHDVIGYNYRMTNICAAIGLAQLEQADVIIDKKRKIADIYYKHFENSTKVTMLREKNNLRNSYWMVCLLFENKDIKNAVRIKLAENRIESRPLFPPVHTMPMYKDENIIAPIANDLSNNGINLPSFVNLDSDKINKICEIIKKSI